MPTARDDAPVVVARGKGGGYIGRAALSPRDDTYTRAVAKPLHV